MSKLDILQYLEGLKKPESEDPRRKSIGTYNGRQMVLLKFFKWLYDPDEPNQKKRTTPPRMSGVRVLPRKERTYSPEDIWLQEDHALFLKYCYVPRDRCWHTMVHDTSARPHEIINLKIKDVKFKVSENGTQYAEMHVSDKTGSRTLPLISSIPYIKEWLADHPFSENGEAPLFVSLGKATYVWPLYLEEI